MKMPRPRGALKFGLKDYLVDHSIIHYFVGKNGKFIDFFGKNMTAKVASSLQLALLERYLLGDGGEDASLHSAGRSLKISQDGFSYALRRIKRRPSSAKNGVAWRAQRRSM